MPRQDVNYKRLWGIVLSNTTLEWLCQHNGLEIKGYCICIFLKTDLLIIVCVCVHGCVRNGPENGLSPICWIWSMSELVLRCIKSSLIFNGFTGRWCSCILNHQQWKKIWINHTWLYSHYCDCRLPSIITCQDIYSHSGWLYISYIQCSAVITRSIFSKIITKDTP